MNQQLARIVGPAIGGVALALGGLAAVTIIDSASFVIAAALILAIRSPRSFVPDVSDQAAGAQLLAAESAWRRLVNEWRAGLVVVWNEPVLRALLVFVAVTRVGEGLTSTLFVPWATDVLHTDAAGYGALQSTQAVGGLIGAVAIGRFGMRADPILLLVTGGLAFGLIDLVLFTYPLIYPFVGPAFIGMLLVGVPVTAVGTGFSTLQQTRSPDTHRGRAIGAIAAVGAVGSLIGASGAGLLGEFLPIVALLVVQGGGYVLATVVFVMLMRGRGPTVPAGP
jgi:Na+/melibiose symporter-like transporter